MAVQRAEWMQFECTHLTGNSDEIETLATSPNAKHASSLQQASSWRLAPQLSGNNAAMGAARASANIFSRRSRPTCCGVYAATASVHAGPATLGVSRSCCGLHPFYKRSCTPCWDLRRTPSDLMFCKVRPRQHGLGAKSMARSRLCPAPTLQENKNSTIESRRESHTDGAAPSAAFTAGP